LSEYINEPGADFETGSESGDMNTSFSPKRERLAVRKTTEMITTIAKDNPYNRTTIEFLFDLYHEKKILVKAPIRPIFKP
jgi:hypothetical protein